jgi:ribosome biogenesis GTPase
VSKARSSGEPAPGQAEGLVLRIDKNAAHVEVGDAVHVLPLRGKLFEAAAGRSRPLAVGDRVVVSPAAAGGAIERVLPRTSKLSRRSAGYGEREQVVAANVSLIVVVMAARQPAFDSELVDRILAAAERERITAVLAITKMDLDDGKATGWIDLYRRLGYRVIPTSLDPAHPAHGGLAETRELLRENVSVLVGASGVGKSSLVNALAPELARRVESVSKVRKGRHTTTHTQLVALPGGGHLLDTPGVRTFGLFCASAQEIAFYFRELAALQKGCAYRSCGHRHEPGCAVRAAAARGEVAASRLRTYELMLADAEAEASRERHGL